MCDQISMKMARRRENASPETSGLVPTGGDEWGGEGYRVEQPGRGIIQRNRGPALRQEPMAAFTPSTSSVAGYFFDGSILTVTPSSQCFNSSV